MIPVGDIPKDEACACESTPMIVVHNLRLICPAAPTLWQGRVGERGSISIRYRWGGLLVRVSHDVDDPHEEGEIIYEGRIGTDPGDRTGDSWCGEGEMQAALKHLCIFEHDP
jgi:hypothetical protein